jgi:phenylacetate-CoA ligase
MSLTHQLFLQTLRELANREQEKFDAHRMPLIASLLDHAWSAVPAYRARFAGQVSSNSFDLARWCELPLLRRDDIAALDDGLEASALPPEAKDVEDLPDQPLPLRRRSRLATVAAECEREWFYERNGIDLAAPLAVLHPDCPGLTQGRGWSITFAHNKWLAGDCNGDARQQMAWLVESGARLLRTNAVIGERLAEAQAQSRVRPSIEAIIIVDAKLTPERRAAIQATMRVPVVHAIEIPDLGMIAARDPGGGYFVSAATCVVEVVDDDGRAVPNASVGELVITPLYEYAAPRLRFATGIRAIPEPEPGTLIGVRRLAAVGELNGAQLQSGRPSFHPDHR